MTRSSPTGQMSLTRPPHEALIWSRKREEATDAKSRQGCRKSVTVGMHREPNLRPGFVLFPHFILYIQQ